jgi:predicted lipoprotein
MSIKRSIIASTISVLFFSACGGGGSSSNDSTVASSQFTYDASELITNLTKDIIVSGYADLNTKAQLFHAATVELANAPTAENLEAAKLAWQEVRVPWEQGEAHIFGPVDALSIDPHLDTWPLNTSDLQTLLTTQTSFSSDEISAWNDDVQGFHTMEFLLFGDGVDDNVKAISELTALEQEYLAASAEVFQGYTEMLHNAWVVANDPNDSTSPAYQDLLLSPNNDVYSSQLGVVEELINGMIGIIDEVGNGKIAEPFGSDINSTDTSLVESQYSWNSLADFTDNIRGVQNVYRGEFADEADKTGLIDFISAADPVIAQRVDAEISTAIEAIKAISGTDNLPFRQAINDAGARVKIQTAIDALAVLQTSREIDVLTQLQNWTT